MSEEVQVVHPKRRINLVWLLPIIAGLLGIYMVVYTYMTEGPEITIVFSTAEGMTAGKTKIKARSVEIGTVDKIVLHKDLEHIVLTASIDAAAAKLLREDTQFWVVRARVGPGGISGLATILSGGYIELAPGEGAPGRKHFDGLEDPPVTPAGAAGLHLILTSTKAGSVSAGDAVLFRGYRVGRVETAELDLKAKVMDYSLFIEAPYDSLVSEGTRFWNASGLSLTAGTDGIDFEMSSLSSLIAGGVAFAVPDGADPGGPVENNAKFRLYANAKSTSEQTYQHYIQYVVRFDQSLRGLRPGAPVEYRGIRIGTVDRAMYKDLFAQEVMTDGRAGQKLPVLIRIEPGRLGVDDTEASVAQMRNIVKAGVDVGMRATLNSGNLLTGALYVGIDFYPDAEPASPGKYRDYPTIPTLSSGIARIERQIGDLLERLNALPLDTTVANLNDTLEQAAGALDAIRRLAGSEGTQALPGQLDVTLKELRRTIESFSSDSELYSNLERTTTELNRTLQQLQDLAQRFEDQPNSIIFSTKTKPDPEPRATP
jgi:paraquat-inducible protein B